MTVHINPFYPTPHPSTASGRALRVLRSPAGCLCAGLEWESRQRPLLAGRGGALRLTAVPPRHPAEGGLALTLRKLLWFPRQLHVRNVIMEGRWRKSLDGQAAPPEQEEGESRCRQERTDCPSPSARLRTVWLEIRVSPSSVLLEYLKGSPVLGAMALGSEKPWWAP